MKTRKKNYLTVWVSDADGSIAKKLAVIAHADKRSLAQQVAVLIEREFDHRERDAATRAQAEVISQMPQE